MYFVENAGRFGSASFSMFNTICGIQNEKPSIVSGQVSEDMYTPLQSAQYLCMRTTTRSDVTQCRSVCHYRTGMGAQML